VELVLLKEQAGLVLILCFQLSHHMVVVAVEVTLHQDPEMAVLVDLAVDPILMEVLVMETLHQHHHHKEIMAGVDHQLPLIMVPVVVEVRVQLVEMELVVLVETVVRALYLLFLAHLPLTQVEVVVVQKGEAQLDQEAQVVAVLE
jgi:hypothetical protein